MKAQTPQLKRFGLPSIWIAIIGTLVCAGCGATAGTGAAADTRGAASGPSTAPSRTAQSRYPSSIAVLGHSGTTGYDSDPTSRSHDALANSWATGTNPAVDSLYLRVLAHNPAVRNHAANFGIDGSDVDSLVLQEKQAAQVTPAPDLVIIQSIDNDVKCDGTDDTNYEPYRQKLTEVMDALTRDLPRATIFFVHQWGDVKEYDRVVSQVEPAHITGTGPCDTIDATTGTLSPERETYLQGIVDHYFAIIVDVCGRYPTCRTDQGAMQKLRLEPADLTPDRNHLSISGLRKMAAIAYTALFGEHP